MVIVNEDIKIEPYTFLAVKYPKSNLLGIETRALELINRTGYEMVKRGYRDADIIHLNPYEFDIQIQEIYNDGLMVYPLKRVKRYNGFGSSREIVKEIDLKNTFIYACVAKEKSVIERFKKAEYSNQIDHKTIGDLLGYPECCIDRFCAIWPGSPDPVFEIAGNSNPCEKTDFSITVQDDYPLLRQHMRYFGFRVIPWLPCSTNCKESLERSKVWLEVMKSIDEKTSNNITDFLSKPSVWSMCNSQIIVEHPDFLGYASGNYLSEKRVVKYV